MVCARGGRRSVARLARSLSSKEKLESLRFQASEETRKGNLQRAAELQYGEIPKLEAELNAFTLSRMRGQVLTTGC